MLRLGLQLEFLPHEIQIPPVLTYYGSAGYLHAVGG